MSAMTWWRGALCVLGFGATLAAQAEGAVPFVNDYGGIGLWQTPSARFGDDGQLSMGLVANSPYNHLFITVQPTATIEASFRYTEITNRLYGPESFSGKQSYKDRGIDIRFRLLQESDIWPAVALGLRDPGGTKLFDSEYLVASRRYYDFDFSLGLGWGRLGSGGPIHNPLERSVNDSGSGHFTLSSIFSSPKIGVFGGVTWQSPIEGLQLSAEYDSNDFHNEAFNNSREVKFPINVGGKYRFASGVTAGVSYQRGSILSLQLGFGLNLATPAGVPKLLDPPPPQPRQLALKLAIAKGTPEVPTADPLILALRVEQALKIQRIAMDGFALSDDAKAAQVWVPSAPYRDTRKLIGRSARAASAVLPDSVQRITVTGVASGVETYDAEVIRPVLEKAAVGAISLDEFQRALTISAPSEQKPVRQYSPVSYPQFGWSLNPALRSSIGGPDQFYFGQLWLKLGGYVNLTPNWSADSQLGVNIYNNFSSLKLKSDSQLPHVRSDIKDYLKDGQQALVRLETNYLTQLAPSLYGRVSAGIFEEMFGGVAAELLYRPDNPMWAVGVNVNRVRQRQTDQLFSFRKYEVTTGNLTAYFELPRPSVLVKLSVGQYLAGDRGATIDVSRQFPNGVRIGIFATKTNVSAQQFGEGEFDKGIYIVVPLDAMLPRSTTGSGSFLFRPLTRDGGQMVRDGRSLYDTTYSAVKARLPLRDNLFFE